MDVLRECCEGFHTIRLVPQLDSPQVAECPFLRIDDSKIGVRSIIVASVESLGD